VNDAGPPVRAGGVPAFERGGGGRREEKTLLPMCFYFLPAAGSGLSGAFLSGPRYHGLDAIIRFLPSGNYYNIWAIEWSVEQCSRPHLPLSCSKAQMAI
jgi:hypothetical protein